MPSPILIIASALGAAFLLGLLDERRTRTAWAITLATLGFMGLVSALWLLALATGQSSTVDVFTAGTPPPFAINLRMGLAEAALSTLVTLTGLFAAIALKAPLWAHGRRAMAVLLILVMALAGIILTRDLFNLFVFFELAVIATAGMILLADDERALSAGFKYLIVAQFFSALLLIGIIFAYQVTGTLNLDGMLPDAGGAHAGVTATQVGAIAFFLMLIALIAELKPFPANGWALDIYESAHPAFSAIFSAASGAAALFAVDKLLAIGGDAWLGIATGVGIVTFLVANVLALPQRNDRRLLGYSSVAQTGLVLVVIGQRDILGDGYLFIAFGILVAHAVAKAGLYWLSGLIAGRGLEDWAALRTRPLLMLAFASFLALLTGLPPFPSFYAKWDLVHLLASHDRLALLGFVLFGTLIEAGYLFRWFGHAIKRAAPADSVACPAERLIPILTALVAAWGLGYLWGALSGQANLLLSLPLLFALAFVLLDWLPARIKNTLAIAGMLGYFALTYQDYDPLRLIFALIFLVGGAIVLLASYHAPGRRAGFYPSAMLMYAGLAMLVQAQDSFAFFAAWELLTVGSYFLILRGKASEPHALSYMLFSLGGAFLILAGFALAAQGQLQLPLEALGAVVEPLSGWVFLLLAVGFMSKTAVLGLHIWLPGAHAEAETDVSPMVSGILLKAGLLGLFILVMNMGKQQLYGVELTHLMLWLGALTALAGNLLAAFQEDAKRLLAYSSIGQMGYAVFGLALMNHLGWLMALMFVINHYIYKSMLFLSVGGVAKRTGTRDMYRMGGLITLMPLSFIAVLIGIIAISGVPPLSGFGGRWIFYNAILDSDARLPMIVLFFAGPIAFLYLFRLIHTIFLGQLKDEHRRVREAPFWIVLPQMLFVTMLIIFAVVPGMALRHVDAYISQFIPNGALSWQGLTITSQYGYWSPVSIMIIIGVIFMLVFGYLLLINRRAQKVKQFNIAFAAERPYRPETTHFAWNFFAPYRKALGFLMLPLVTRFWSTLTDLLNTAGDLGRRLYTGNGQTYAIHFLVFVVIVFLLGMGGQP
ncbi:NADH-quinone oxidoreductase subunit F [Thiohalocapsa marina]|uniref:NADH-quinone oxidoreductase subunit F n=1 Tax=Thiohalocapsa marina TaxID=424902 RepID=A0A5M8FQ00_9GAMM|nr:proton-conducting transporter membrane subunit [Thiohalocapsa marina]KAA6186070.1 NADH-quinone oxidoreductase subunit F [Thiohalocapsa marina]